MLAASTQVLTRPEGDAVSEARQAVFSHCCLGHADDALRELLQWVFGCRCWRLLQRIATQKFDQRMWQLLKSPSRAC